MILHDGSMMIIVATKCIFIYMIDHTITNIKSSRQYHTTHCYILLPLLLGKRGDGRAMMMELVWCIAPPFFLLKNHTTLLPSRTPMNLCGKGLLTVPLFYRPGRL